MNFADLIVVLVALAITQTIAFFSAKSVLGAESGWKINSLLGLACLVTVWGPAYAGILAESVALWLVCFAGGVSLVVYGIRRRTLFQISVKQGFLIYWAVVFRLLISAAALGAIARGLTLLIKNIAVN